MRRRVLGGHFGRGRIGQVAILAEYLEQRSLLSAVGGALSSPSDPLPEHLPGEILVKFRSGTSAADAAAVRASVDGDIVETLNTSLMQSTNSGWLERISFNSGFSIQQAMQLAQASPAVQFAEPNYICRPAVVSNDPQYLNGSLWGTYSGDTPVSVGPSGTTNINGSQAEQIWNRDITGSSAVFIGVIDEGIQVTHPDLAANMWVNPFEIAGNGIDDDGNGYRDDIHGWDFFNDDSSVYDDTGDDHGTHCAGTIGAVGGNSEGIAGVSWDVTMVSCKFLGPGGGSTSDAILAVDYLTDLKRRHGLNIVASSNSWGGGGYSQGLHEAIIRSAKANTLFIAAAGNNARNNDSTSNYPSNYNTTIATAGETAASYDAVIAVAAIDAAGNLAGFSNFGATTVDIGAPGVGIVSTVPLNGYASYQGTSMATPHVSGAVALYASVQPEGFPAADIRRALLTSATPTSSLSGRTVTGARLNVAEMILRDLVSIDTSSLSDTTEGGGQSTFTVKLSLQPTADVTIPISSSDTNEGTVDVSQLVFTPANWSTPQTVTLSGVDDLYDDGDVSWTVVLGAISSADALFNGRNPDDVQITNFDDDTAELLAENLSGSQTTEAGGTVTFTIRLATIPLATVTVLVGSNDTTEGIASPASLTFTDLDWSTPQTVTVTGQDDAIFDSNISYFISIRAQSADTAYDTLTAPDINLININDEPPPPPKFFVVDANPLSGSSVFRYDPQLNFTVSSQNNASNLAPRGIATTAAGQRLWVIDNNQTVFVYTAAGVLEGFWKAAGLPWNALPEGIATDGTNIWILDNRSDRVYFYAAAASRLSGFQSPRTNFALALGNINPKDITYGFQDGAGHLWVVNDDRARDRVFRYRLNAQGVTVGSTSWNLDVSVASPTGITVDPSNGSMDLWVVDDMSDTVLTYRSGRTLVAPAQTAAAALDAANTSPQGIADPPPYWNGEAPITTEPVSANVRDSETPAPRSASTRGSQLRPPAPADDTAALASNETAATTPRRTTQAVRRSTASANGAGIPFAPAVPEILQQSPASPATSSELDLFFTLLPQLL